MSKENWEIKLKTETRDALIDVSGFIAQAFDPAFFLDPDNIPYVLVPGDGGGGKCMVLEAMMKSILDGYDHNDMKHPDSSKEMFIENNPCAACHEVCTAFGLVSGQPVMLGFDRVTERRDRSYGSTAQGRLVRAFQETAQQKQDFAPHKPQGAIFASGVGIGDTKPWLLINLEYTGSSNSWERKLTIEVRDDRLKKDRRFKSYWDKLKKFAETGNEKYIRLKKKSASQTPMPSEEFENSAFYLSASYTSTTTDPQAILLKFAVENAVSMSISDEYIGHSAAIIADTGDLERTRNFLSWLKEKGHTNILNEILKAAETPALLTQAVLDENYPVSIEDVVGAKKKPRQLVLKAIKQDRYTLVHDLIDAGRFERVKDLIALMKQHGTDAALARMLSQDYLSQPVKKSVLHRLASEGQTQLVQETLIGLDPSKFEKSRDAIEINERERKVLMQRRQAQHGKESDDQQQSQPNPNSRRELAIG